MNPYPYNQGYYIPPGGQVHYDPATGQPFVPTTQIPPQQTVIPVTPPKNFQNPAAINQQNSQTTPPKTPPALKLQEPEKSEENVEPALLQEVKNELTEGTYLFLCQKSRLFKKVYLQLMPNFKINIGGL